MADFVLAVVLVQYAYCLGTLLHCAARWCCPWISTLVQLPSLLRLGHEVMYSSVVTGRFLSCTGQSSGETNDVT